MRAAFELMVFDRIDVSAVKIISILIFIFFLLVLSFIDMKRHIIPDKILIFFAGTGILINTCIFLLVFDYWILISALAGFISGIFPLFLAIVLSKGKMGAGDMKLLGVIGIWTGPVNTLLIFFISVLLAGIFAVFMLLLRKMNIKSELPLGPFMLLGSIACIAFNDSLMNIIGRVLLIGS